MGDYYIPKNARTHNNTCRHCRNANITRTRNNDASLRLTLAKLLGLPNAVLAPHIAWLTPETLVRSLTVAHENCRRLVAGEPLLHQVV